MLALQHLFGRPEGRGDDEVDVVVDECGVFVEFVVVVNECEVVVEFVE